MGKAGRSNTRGAGGRNKGKRPMKKRKMVVTYDADARKDFITGFHKRKVERRERALKELEETARKEKIAARKEYRDAANETRLERRKALGLPTRPLNPKPDKRVSRAEQDLKADQANMQKIGGDKSTVNTTEYKVTGDKFTKQRFGSGVVTVTTTTLDTTTPRAVAAVAESVEGGDIPKQEKKRKQPPPKEELAGWGTFSGQKNVKLPASEASKKLDRLRAPKSKKGASKSTNGAKIRSKKKKSRGGTKTGAKERRRRK